jgi:GNAT superfamily N-acetyltransferase
MLRGGRCFGYLAYVDDRPAAWVNASLRSDYALYRRGSDAGPADAGPADAGPADAGPADAGPADAEVVGISCFIVAPAYRRHGLATAMLERILADAAARGVAWVEAYPFNDPRDDDAANFRGPRRLFERYGFQPVEADGRHTVMRRTVGAPQVTGQTSATVPPRPGP